MGITIDPTTPEPDRSGIAKPAIETVARLLAGIVGVTAGGVQGVPDSTSNFSGATESAFETIKAFRAVRQTPGQRAWTLWRESLALTMVRFFETASLTRKPDGGELETLLSRILEDSEKACTAATLQFTKAHLRTPTAFPLYPALQKKLPGYAKNLAPDHIRDDEWLKGCLDRAFERGFQRALFEAGEFYEPLLAAFEGEAARTSNRRDEWQRYYDWLWLDVSDRPLFGQEEGGASLADIYQPLRSYWRVRGKRCEQDSEEEREPDQIYVAWLSDELKSWLAAQKGDDSLRVINGGPGCGKSSSAKMLARDVAFAGRCNVFLVPLQGLEVDRTIDEIIDEFVHMSRGNRGALGTNPLNWLADDPKSLLLIFDGLDEVARPDGAGLEVTHRFLNALRSQLDRVNSGESKARLMAIALGRPQAAEEAVSAVGGLDDRTLLHVAPLCPLKEVRLGDDGHHGAKIHDTEGLCDKDFRKAFWQRYRWFDEKCQNMNMPTALVGKDLEEMTSEPLLLYLLLYSGIDWQSAGVNRNGIYQAIFAKIHDRDLRKLHSHQAKRGLEKEEDFLALMECLGLAAWIGGGRTGTDQVFATIRDRVYITKRGVRFKDMKSAELRNVAVQTFTHRGGGDEPGYAFIHKSFGEYLTARAIIQAGDTWLERHEGELEDFAKDWLQLTCGAELTEEILRFMVDEVKIRAFDVEEARRKVTALTSVANHIIAVGFPAYSELFTVRDTPHWRRRETAQNNAEQSLYALLHAWGEAGYPYKTREDGTLDCNWEPGPIKIDWSGSSNPIQIVATSLHSLLGKVRNPLFQRWDFCNARVMLARVEAPKSEWSIRFSSFPRTDFSGMDLRGANFETRITSGTRPQNEYNWNGNLTAADLTNTDLRGVNLKRAGLRRASLGDADLRSANLSSVNLSMADLKGAEMGGTDLSGANLKGAELGGANLSGADLSGATNLLQEQIDGAFGSSETKLPNNMRTPEHWLVAND